MTQKPRSLEAPGEVDYDYKNDILFFKVKDREYDRSIEFQNLVIDVDSENFITGLQIFNASEYLGLPKENLRNVPNWKFQSTTREGAIEIRLFFQTMLRNKIIENRPIIQLQSEENLPNSEIIVEV